MCHIHLEFGQLFIKQTRGLAPIMCGTSIPIYQTERLLIYILWVRVINAATLTMKEIAIIASIFGHNRGLVMMLLIKPICIMYSPPTDL